MNAGEDRRTVLVVDDEQRIADTLVLILGTKGYEAEAAYDGMSALARCRERSFDLILSDVVMPGMSGIELGLAVRQESPATLILLFSGQAATADMLDQAQQRGHLFELLAKPIHPEKLLEKIRQMLAQSAGAALLPNAS